MSSAATDDAGLHLTLSQINAVKAMSFTLTCTLCEQFFTNPYSTECGHTFCYECIKKHLREKKKRCPTCSSVQLETTLWENGRLVAFIQHVRDLLESPLVQNSRSHVDEVPATLIPAVTIDSDTARSPAKGAESDQMSAPLNESLAVTTQQINKFKSELESAKERTKQFDAVLQDFHVDGERLEQVSSSSRGLRKVFISGITSSSTLKQLKRLAEVDDQVLISEDFENDNPTHLIICAQSKNGQLRCVSTYKYFWALSKGCSILAETWLDECERLGNWAPETDFKVYSSSAGFSLQRPFSPTRLFSGIKVILGPFHSSSVVFTRPQCKTLLELNDATFIDVNANEDGCATIPLNADQLQFIHSMEKAVVLVGHPAENMHTNESCSFCKNVSQNFMGKECIIVDSAWVMLCLDTLQVKDFENFRIAICEG